MKKVFLAIQTPRAGKWNHRWLVPFENDGAFNENDLRELLSKLKQKLPKDIKTNQPPVESPQLSAVPSSEVLHNSCNDDVDSSDNENYDSPSDFPVGQRQETDNVVNPERNISDEEPVSNTPDSISSDSLQSNDDVTETAAPQDSTIQNIVENVTDGMNLDANASDSTEETLSDNVNNEPEVNNELKDNLVRSSIVEDGILLSKNTVQGLASSGRTGVEELFLYAKGFGKTVPEDKRKECFEKLSVFFNDKLEGIIKTIDWDNASPAMVHTSADLKNLAGGLTSPLAEFDRLYSELADLLNPFITEPEPSDSSESDDSGSGPQPEPPKPKKSSCFQYVLGLCVIIALFIPIVLMAQSGTFGETFKHHAEDVVKLLKDIFNPQQNSDSFDDEYQKTWSQLFDFSRIDKQDNPKQLVEETIKQTYRYYYPNGQPTDAQCNLIKTVDGNYNGTFTRKLANLKGNLKVLSDKTDNPEFECFRNVKPEEFRKLVDSFPEAAGALKEILNYHNNEADPDIYTAWLGNYDKDTVIKGFKITVNNNVIYPKFYVDSDLDDANTLKKFVERINQMENNNFPKYKGKSSFYEKCKNFEKSFNDVFKGN